MGPEPVVRGGYCISLADGSVGHLLTTVDTDDWIRKLAGVMDLERLDCGLFEGEAAGKGEDVTRRPISQTYSQVFRCGVLTLWSNGNGTCVVSGIGEPEYGELNLEIIWRSFFPFYKLLIGRGGLPLHAALVQRGGKCVLLAAPGGTGKSTCCRRLPAGWGAISDEEAVLVPLSDGVWHAHPFPAWSDIVERKLDRRWDVKRHFPVSAVFFLEQGEIDCAEPVGLGDAALLLNRRVREKCSFPDWSLGRNEARGLRQDLFENVCRLARAIPAYKLVASRDGRFWEEMEAALNV